MGLAEIEAEAFGTGQGGQHVGDFADDFGSVHRFDEAFHLAGLDAGYIQRVVEYGHDVLGAGGDHADVAHLFGVEGAGDLLAQEVGEAYDGGHGRAQLVAHGGQEAALVFAGAEGGGVLLFEAVVEAGAFDGEGDLLGDDFEQADFMHGEAVGLGHVLIESTRRFTADDERETDERAYAFAKADVLPTGAEGMAGDVFYPIRLSGGESHAGGRRCIRGEQSDFAEALAVIGG